jgi:hypothetical protein
VHSRATIHRLKKLVTKLLGGIAYFFYLNDLVLVLKLLCIYLALVKTSCYNSWLFELLFCTYILNHIFHYRSYHKVGFLVCGDLDFEDGLMDDNDLVCGATTP